MTGWQRLAYLVGQRPKLLLAATAATSTSLLYYSERKNLFRPNVSMVSAEERSSMLKRSGVGCHVSGLPEISMEEVRRHDGTPESGGKVWVTFGRGVYDITDFVPKHPGSAQIIMMAAGGPIEPFWNVYAVHKESSEAHQLLEQCRIGNLSEKEAMEQQQAINVGSTDPFLLEPVQRHPSLLCVSQRPFNAETPLHLLSQSFLTPNEIFYVRNHLPTPLIDEKDFLLEVTNLNGKSVELSMDDLRKLPVHHVIATVQCGGNRRAEMSRLRKIKGLDWQGGAIGNAKWTGVRLRDVLKLVDFDDNSLDTNNEDSKELHVQFEGADVGADGSSYGASIPAESALRPDVLLAFAMNDQKLPRDHGYPLRVIVPGVVGARHVKWLKSINVSNEESDSHWQRNDYKTFGPYVNWDNVDFSKVSAIQNLPVTSKICWPHENQLFEEHETIEIRGYAYSGGGNRVVRVDVSLDEGSSWIEAELVQQDEMREPRHFGWTLWKCEVKVVKNREKKFVVWSKAVDSNCNTQPENCQHIWNLRGLANNAYSKLQVNVK